MISYDPDAEIRRIAADRIFARHNELVDEQKGVRMHQQELASRDREIERELAECRAAAKFFNIVLDPFADDPQVQEMRERLRMERLRAEDVRGRPEWGMYNDRALRSQARLDALLAAKQAEFAIAQTMTPEAVAATDRELRSRQPKVRDLVLDRLREVGIGGDKAASIRGRIEAQNSLRLHEKTVGMTLYRLSKEGLVHRKGQTWFYGSQAERTLLASPEGPDAAAPGVTQEDQAGKE